MYVANLAERSAVPDVSGDTERLIDRFRRNAAGEAFNRALDCALLSDNAGEDHWRAVARLVMEMQDRGRDVGPV
jgi:hypothetical protein